MRDQLKETALIPSLPKEIYFFLVQIHNRRPAGNQWYVGICYICGPHKTYLRGLRPSQVILFYFQLLCNRFCQIF